MSHLGDMFKSKEEKEARGKEYMKYLFPFGQEHLDLVKNKLNQMYTKHPEGVVFFNYIVSKERLLKNTDSEVESKVTKQLRKIRPRLGADDLSIIRSFLDDDIRSTSLEEVNNNLLKY